MKTDYRSYTDKPVLVAVDFSECSRAALVAGSKLADRISAPLVILHVAHESPGRVDYPRRHNGGVSLAPIEEIAAGMLDELVEEVSLSHPEIRSLSRASRRTVGGLPASRICEVAEHHGARLIVVGSHGRSAMARLMVGSVSEAVLEKAKIPVTVIKPDDVAIDPLISSGQAEVPEARNTVH